MSLFSTIQQSNNALQAAQIGLQVVGQNIANANTPGYSREEVLLKPAPTQRLGGLLLGLGVQVDGIVQKIDTFLEQRLRTATADRTSSETQEQTYSELESIIGELSDTDLSTSLTTFFSSIQEVLNSPEDIGARNLAVLKGQTLAGDINSVAKRVARVREDLNTKITSTADDINRLLEDVRSLNTRITATEGGDTSKSDAVGLRDQRNLALSKLSELIDIQVQEQRSGAVNVFAGGEFLVFEGTARKVNVTLESDGQLKLATIKLADTDSPIKIVGGKLAGLLKSRDDILGGFQNDLNGFARSLAYDFNKIFSSGQGLSGYQNLTSEFGVGSNTAPLDAAGLPFTPNSGSFEIQIYDIQTKLFKSTNISIDLDGLDKNDTTLQSLANKLNAIDGLDVSITADRKLKFATSSANLQVAFNNDTSGVLASLGINTFFSGTSAQTLGVQAVLKTDPGKLATSTRGIGSDTSNAVLLGDFAERPLSNSNGATLSDLYDRFIGKATQGASVAHAVAEGHRVFEETLRGQQAAVSGVSIDEEAVQMISFQRMYQASARLIATLNELMETLVNL